MAIHPNNRHQVSAGKEIICTRQIAAPNKGTNGTKGVLNALGALGDDFLRMITPIDTITKASKVPIDTNCPNKPIGKSPANIIDKIPVTHVVT